MAAHAPRADWLHAAVGSALAQAGCSIEVVIVDDGSPQPVVAMLEDVTDARLRVVRIKRAGLGGARNAGIAASTGRFLRFIDADDIYPVDSTARLLDLAERGRDVLACGAARWCREDLEPILDRRVRWRGDPVRALLLMRCTIVPPAAMLVPRPLAEAVGPWRTDLVMLQDTEYLLRLLELGELVATRRVVVWYRQHPTSLSRNGAVAWPDRLHLVETYFDRRPAERGTRIERQARAALELLAAELERWPRGPWRDRRFWRGLARDPTAIEAVYERQAQPRLSRVKMLARSQVRRT